MLSFVVIDFSTGMYSKCHSPVILNGVYKRQAVPPLFSLIATCYTLFLTSKNKEQISSEKDCFPR